jgi:anti-sigma factor RsiW
LDEYLLGMLAEDEAAAFAAHLGACPECREEAALQRRIDGLLAEASATLEAIPASLSLGATAGLPSSVWGTAGQARSGTRHRIGRANRGPRRWVRWAGILAVAAGLLLAVGLWAIRLASPVPEEERPMAQAPVAPPPVAPVPSPPSAMEPPRAEPPAAPPTRVAMADPSSAIVVPRESHNPNVAVFFVYPTVKADRGEPSPN